MAPKSTKLKQFVDNRGRLVDLGTSLKRFSNELELYPQNIIYTESNQNALRGLHYQENPGLIKQLFVLEGTILDVIVNIDQRSSDFLKPKYFLLQGNKPQVLLIPDNYLHGHITISEYARLIYFITGDYNPQGQFTVRWNDSTLDIAWTYEKPILSEKDKKGLSINTFLEKISLNSPAQS